MNLENRSDQDDYSLWDGFGNEPITWVNESVELDPCFPADEQKGALWKESFSIWMVNDCLNNVYIVRNIVLDSKLQIIDK